MADEIKLSSNDKKLLEAAETGEGLVPVTEELLAEVQQTLKERDMYMKEHWPRLVSECPYETRLAITAEVFKAIVEHANEGGSFRYLIYDRLGFSADAYYPLYRAGGMMISNEFDLSEY